MRRALPCFAAALTLSLAASSASANGRFPIADQLVVDPSDASHIVLRTTYGILETSDAGAKWSWICEAAVGYGGTQDPAIGILSDGTVLAGVFEGLGVTHDRGCSWAMVGGVLEGEYIIDVSVQKDDPKRGVAMTSTGTGMGFHVIVAETSDNGATWAQAGTAIMSDFIALTIDVAPSDPNRIYASGLVGKVLAPAIERSDDRGKTWVRTYLDAAYAGDVPFLAAIDPQDPNRIYLRLSGDPVDRLLMSTDGAATWSEVFTGTDDLLGFALSPDGSRVAVGGPKDGVQVAATADLMFTKTSSLYTRCLTWTDAGLYACANEFTDNFTVGLSKDEGKTFQPIYHLPDICPIECPEGAPAPAACVQTWPGVAATLGIEPTACGGTAPSTSSSSSSSSGAGGSSTTTNNGSSCTCGTSGASALGGAGITFAFASFAARLRRRRRAPR